jgi:hypothetical protein
MGYTLDDLKGISPTICQHAINMEPDGKPVVEHQRRLIPKMKEVVRNEVLKLLDAGIIYPIADSRFVNPIHCVPKKGGITVVPNENNELIPQRVVVGYRICIDFRKVNKVTKKDHYPLPFIDQMLERLSKKTLFTKKNLRKLIFVFWMVILVSLRLLFKSKIKGKPLLLVLTELMLIDVCLLVCAMLLLLFKDACLLFFMVFVKKLWRYSWMISPSMELLLIIVCTILIKFCRGVKKLILFLTGKNATLW